MAWKTNVLVVANVTADSDELLSALRQRADRGATGFFLVLPPRAVGERGRAIAQERLERALARARERGLEIDGGLGDCDPVVAVAEAFDPRVYDEIIVSTLPVGPSRWLLVDLPHRVERMTGVPVQHVVAQEPREPARSVHRPPAKRRAGLLTALAPLAWARRREGPGHHSSPTALPARRAGGESEAASAG